MAWADIDPAGPFLAIGCERAEYVLAEQIPGCNFSKKDSIWRAPLSWPAWVAFATVWSAQPIDVKPALLRYSEQAWMNVLYAYHIRSSVDAADAGVAGLIDTVEQDGKLKLFTHQRGAVNWLLSGRKVSLTDPQGNGKTPPVIRALQILASREIREGLPALVVTTGGMLGTWREEFARWAPELAVATVAGTALARRKALTAEPRADVYLIAWPNVRAHTRLAHYWGTAFARCDEHGGSTGKTAAQCEVHEGELDALGFKTVVADEAHRMQDAKSKQARAVTWLAWKADHFWPLTGTPIGDTIEGLWPVCRAIDPAAFPQKSRFLDLYAITRHQWNGGRETLGLRPEHADAFHVTVQPLMRRIPKEIARPFMPARLPVVTFATPMQPAQAKMYRQMEKQLLADLPDGHVAVPGYSIEVFSRLVQLASGTLASVDGEDPAGFTKQELRLVLPSSTADGLAAFLEDNPDPLVCYCWSRQVLGLCKRKLGQAKIASAEISGGMDPDQMDAARHQFQRGDVPVIFITAAGSEGITLTRASTIAFLVPEPSYFRREQAIGRVDRIGQADPVRVVDFVTPGTVHERLAQLGADKAERAAQVVSDASLMRWIVTGQEMSEPAGSVA